MKKYNMITPEGTKDILFEECIARRTVESKVGGLFRSRGYHEVITPGLEYFDVFDLPGAAIPQFEMYKSADNKGRLVVFRPDLTLPIARLTATRLKSLSKPIRLYYNQSVYRNSPELSGRSDESAQAGIELLGVSGIRADLEAIVTAIHTLSACSVSYRLEIGHAGLFDILADKLSVTAEIKEDIRFIIESKNYAALSDILSKIEPSPYRDAVAHLPRLFGGEEVFAQAADYCTDPEAGEILIYLQTLYASLQKLGMGDKIMIDLGLVQRNDYYTGVVFSAYSEGHGAAVLMGGRYDNLLEKFNAPMPAVGFGVDVDALASAAEKERELPIPEALIFGQDGFEIAAQLLFSEYIAGGSVCESALFETLAENRAYAIERKIPKLIVVGETTEVIEL